MGDFQANFARPDAGIRTVEGNVAGSRAAMLERKRMLDQEAFEERKRQITQSSFSASRNNANSMFQLESKFSGASKTSSLDQAFSKQTVGLVTAEEFKQLEARRNQAEETIQQESKSTETEEERKERERKEKKESKKKRKEKKKMMSTLSFAHEEDDLLLNDDDDGNHGDGPLNTRRSLKDPTVDTSFLPDKVRDEQAAMERQRLEEEWKQTQERIKQEKLEIIYSYWDGSGHRRTVVCKKGDSIGEFLELVRIDLSKEFRELNSISSDALLYVKEDLIVPQDMTFYDLIATKARGKSGPLFHFDVHDDIRVGAIDTRIEKDESHPGKVVERRWYERNKHIFPASKCNIKKESLW